MRKGRLWPTRTSRPPAGAADYWGETRRGGDVLGTTARGPNLSFMKRCPRHFDSRNGIALRAGFRRRDLGSWRQIVSWVPTSTTRPVGIWKKSVASLADLASAMNSRSCQGGMPDCAAGLSERRDKKND